MDSYILDDDLNPIPVSMEESMDWCKRNKEDWQDKKRMALTEFTCGTRVSTVFLGLDHNHGDGTPILFETLVFDKHGDSDDMTRYTTFDNAIQGHKETVDRVCMTSPVVLVIEKEHLKQRPPKQSEPPRKLEYCKESNNSILRKRLTKRIKP